MPPKSRTFDHLFKVVMVGNTNAGKSCVSNRFSKGNFAPEFPCTIGVDFHLKTVQYRGKLIRVQIWDTAGQERFRSIVPIYFRMVQGLVLAYDCTDINSFHDISMWENQVNQTLDRDIDRILIANKCDCDSQRVVSYETGKSYADSLGIPFFETSAKTGANVDKAFMELIAAIARRIESSQMIEKECELKEPIKCAKTKCC